MDGGLWLHRHVWKGRPMAHLVSTDRERLIATVRRSASRRRGSSSSHSKIRAPACGATPGTGTWAARTSRRRPERRLGGAASLRSGPVQQAPAPARALPQPTRRLQPRAGVGGSGRHGEPGRTAHAAARAASRPPPSLSACAAEKVTASQPTATSGPASRVSTTNCATYQSTIADSPNRIVRIAGWSRDVSRFSERRASARATRSGIQCVAQPSTTAIPARRASGPSRATNATASGSRVETRTSARRMPRVAELSLDRIELRHEGVGRLDQVRWEHW